MRRIRIIFSHCFLTVASVFAILTLREPARGPTVDAFFVLCGPFAAFNFWSHVGVGVGCWLLVYELVNYIYFKKIKHKRMTPNECKSCKSK
jgi:hypothetical protein